MVGPTSVFREVPCWNSSHNFVVEEFAKLMGVCKKLRDLLDAMVE